MKSVFLVCIITMLPCAIVSANITPASANPGQVWEEYTINSAKSWKAGVDSVNQWYGADYHDRGDYASLSYVGKPRSLLYAMNLDAGPCRMDFKMRFDDYTEKFNYWQVYLVRDNVKINLTGNPKWTTKANATRVWYDSVRPGDDDGRWHDYSIDLTISAEQADKYDSMVFVFTGLRRTCETLDFGHFEMQTPSSVEVKCVPVPSALILCSSGIVFLFGMAKKR